MADRRDLNNRGNRTFMHEALKSPEGWICGVCAGLGIRFGIEPAILRVVTIISLIVFTLPTIVVYLILWLVFFRG